MTSSYWAKHPDAYSRAMELVTAFRNAGMHFQCDSKGWEVRIEGEFMGGLCTLWEAGDDDNRINKFVWDNEGNAQSIVGYYVNCAELSGY